jgi:branched-chain amino acid transport system ATP-binding protein
MAETLLEVSGLDAFYGESHVLHGVSFSVHAGEIVSLIGRNGAGKTTTLRAITGLLGQRRGSIRVAGRETLGLPPHRIARLGIGYVPEERGIFATLNVRENLLLPPVIAAGGRSEAELYALFPRLAERARAPGTKLSGGEQQMLAIARVLRTGARLLLLDEPTEGLAPVIVDQIQSLVEQLKAEGATILLVEQHAGFAAAVADRHVVLEDGHVIDIIEGDIARADPARLGVHLGL